MVIAHEMAHMWFGDLVTMTWWEDTWLQESFADYLGYRVSEEAAGIEGALVDFTIGRKPEAYVADERRSTHPVAPRAEDVPDVDAASTNFDALSYAKGNSALRQLVTWIGDDAFYAGVNAYLSRHRWGNATLDDFVDRPRRGDLRPRRPRLGRGLAAHAPASTRSGVTRDDDGGRPDPRGEPGRTGSGSRRTTPTGSGAVARPSSTWPTSRSGSRTRRWWCPTRHGETYARVRLDERVLDGGRPRALADVPEPAPGRCSGRPPSTWCGPASCRRRRVPRPGDATPPAEGHSSIVARRAAWARIRLLPVFVPADGVTAPLASLAATADAALAATARRRSPWC